MVLRTDGFDLPDRFRRHLIKGRDYFAGFGIEYPLRNLGYVLLCLVAMKTRSETFHRTFVIASLIYQASWIYRMFDFVDWCCTGTCRPRRAEGLPACPRAAAPCVTP